MGHIGRSPARRNFCRRLARRDRFSVRNSRRCIRQGSGNHDGPHQLFPPPADDRAGARRQSHCAAAGFAIPGRSRTLRRLGRGTSGLRDVQTREIGAARPRGFGGGGGYGRHAARHCVHARIFKEDIFLAPLVVLALAALVGLLQAPAPRRAVLLGVLIGLAAGAKYIGAVMLPFAVVAIVLIPTPEPPRRLTRALTVAGTAVATFLIVELPALRHLTRFRHGVTFEFGHSLKRARRAPSAEPYLRRVSSQPELVAQSRPAALGPRPDRTGGAADRTQRAAHAAHADRELRRVLVCRSRGLTARYMLPLAPLLAILATSFIYELLARRDRLGIVAAVTVIVGAIPAPWISMRTNGAVEDPRAIIPPSSPPRAPGWQPIATPTTIRPGSFSATVCGRRSRRPISW